MLEDLNKNCVDFKPNYDGTLEEPTTLPSRFPWLLCGNNSGIAVGMSSDLVSHNFTEVAEGIKYFLDHKDCSVADLMQFIKGPDFPTGGKIINGEELLNIYTLGHGAVKVVAHYDITKKGNKTVIIFHDLPYGVEIDNGVKAPLKKLVIDDGYDVFEDINVEKAGPKNFDIKITLSKDADVAKCLEILFNKTRLSESIKINNTVIINGEPKILNLKQMIQYWVNYRSNIITRIARNDYDKTNHKLTITIGLQKCMSDIDNVISIIRNSTNNAAAKIALMQEFSLNDEQATAVLEMKLGRLSKLDLTELNETREDLEKTLAQLKNIIENETVRYDMIKKDLDNIKKIIGEDERLTEIHYAEPVKNLVTDQPLIKNEFRIYSDGLHNTIGLNPVENNLVDVVFSYSPKNIIGYTENGEMRPITELGSPIIGAAIKDEQTKFVTVTKNGYVKVSYITEYKFTKVNERMMKLKDDDQLIYAAFCNDNDYLMLFNGERNVLKLAIKDLPVASKLTIGIKSGFTTIAAATVVNDSDNLLFVTKDNKGKLTPVKDFSTDKRGNKGQVIVEDITIMRRFDNARESIYAIPLQGKPQLISRNKVSIKSRAAIGATLTNRAIKTII